MKGTVRKIAMVPVLLLAGVSAGVPVSRADVASAGMVVAGSGLDDASPAGFLRRAAEYGRAGVWNAVIDQLQFLVAGGLQELDAAGCEEALFMLASACEKSDDPRSLPLLQDFCRKYPASFLSPRARMLIGDSWFFLHDWPEAAAAYSEVNTGRLPEHLRPLLAYRHALSLIRIGHFREARPLVRSLKGKKGYAAVYDFYEAYLDYIAGDFRKAYAGFSRVPAGIPGLDAGYYMTQIEYSRGDYEQAATRGAALLRGDVPAGIRPELQRVVGLSLFKMGDFEVARPYLERYVRSVGSPASPAADALYALGVCDYRDGDTEQAAARFLEVTADPSELGQSAWLYLGQCRLRQNDTREASVAFGKAARMGLDRDVTRTAWYDYVITTTQGAGLPFSSSAGMLEEFVERFPESSYASQVERYLAAAYFNERNYEAALRSVEAIRNPGAETKVLKQKILYELGVEALTNRRTAAAADYLRRCAEMRQCDAALAAEASLWLGDALFASGKYAEARKAYDVYLKGASASVNRSLGFYKRGYALYKAGKYKESAADFTVASRATDLDARRRTDADVRRADCLYYTGDYAAAESLYRNVADAGEAEADYALWRGGVVAGLLGRGAEKEKMLLRLEREYPGSQWLTKGLQELALTYEGQGRAADAADVYRRRLAAGSAADTDELMRMSETMHKAGRWEDLLDITERLSSVSGMSAEDMDDLDLRRADALLNTGSKREARGIYRRLAANPSSLTGARSAVALAESLLKDHEYGEAEKVLLDFTDAGTPHAYWLARGFISLADTYSATGRPTLAKEYLETLAENYPGENDDIPVRIDDALRRAR